MIHYYHAWRNACGEADLLDWDIENHTFVELGDVGEAFLIGPMRFRI